MTKINLVFSLIAKSKHLKGQKVFFLILMSSFLLISCNVNEKRKLGVVDSQLVSCPTSPNCVSSDANNPDQQVEPLELRVSPEKAWGLLLEQVSRLPRAQIIKQTSRYLHVECRSRVFGFIDDLEFYLHPQQNIVAVRSASRSGYYDFGVNRARVEQLRLNLQRRMGER